MPNHWNWSAIRACCRREALRIVCDSNDAEDVVQEALARAWRQETVGTWVIAPVPWCLGITRTEALRLLGERRARSRLERLAPEPAIASGDDFDAAIDRVDVRSALAVPPPHERLLIALRYGADLTQPDVARVMRIPEGTVKVRLHRLRRRLRVRLDADAVTEARATTAHECLRMTSLVGDPGRRIERKGPFE